MKNGIISVAACLAALFSGCESKRNGVQDIREYDFRNSADVIKPLSDAATSFDAGDIIDDIKVVELQTRSDPWRLDNKILLGSDGDIFVMNEEGVYRFSARGEFKYQCGKSGRNDDEYFSLQDMAIDEAAGTILILDAMNKVLFFDYKSGRFVKSVTLDWKGDVLRSDAILPNESDGGFYIFSAKLTKKEIDLNRYCIHQFNEKGVKVAQGLPCDDFVLDVCPVTQSFRNRYLINPVGKESTVWETKVGEFKALYGIDFGKGSLKSKLAYQTRGEIDIHNLLMSDSYKMITNVRDTEDYITFVVCGPEAKSYEYVYSKKNGKNICLTAPDGYAFPVWFQASDDDYFYTIYRRTDMEGLDERACPVSKYLAERLGVIPEKDRPLLVGIKFNFDELP